jgi:hypothetical protein
MRHRSALLCALLLLVAVPVGTADAAAKQAVKRQRTCRVSHKHRVCFWVVVKKHAAKPKPKPKPKPKAVVPVTPTAAPTPAPVETRAPAEARQPVVTKTAALAPVPTAEPQPTPTPTPTPTPEPTPDPAPASPSTPPLWRGDFETGDFSQWQQLDGNLLDTSRYFGIVTSPVFQGRYAFRSTVDGSAVNPAESGQRAMVLLFPNRYPEQNATGAYEGSERWYRSHIYFPADFQPAANNSWNWLVQWHNWPNGPCCSNLALYVDTRWGQDALALRVMGGGDDAHPVENNDIITEKNPAGHLDVFDGDQHIQREHWYDSLVHVKWSADPTKGLVEWWLDGRHIVSKTTSTLYWYHDDNSSFAGATPGPGQAYYMEGYYRPLTLPNGQPDTSTESVYFDGAQLGTTRESVSGS